MVQANQHSLPSSFATELLHYLRKIVLDEFPNRFRRISLNEPVQKPVQQEESLVRFGERVTKSIDKPVQLPW
jgi:hypothetical protein